MRKRVVAILWRKCNKATFDSLNDLSAGQYDIRLTKQDFDNFFVGVERTEITELGGYSLIVGIEPFTGLSPVDLTSVKVRFMGESSGRKDWNIPSQRKATAYPLWRSGRGVSQVFKPNDNEFMLLIRDVDGKFHARWIHHADFNALPKVIQDILSRSEVGWENLN
jgi:5-methylcytosine-specific restriction protein B